MKKKRLAYQNILHEFSVEVKGTTTEGGSMNYTLCPKEVDKGFGEP